MLLQVFCFVFFFFFGGGGGGLHKNVSQMLATIDCSSREITRKTLSAKKNIIGNITSSQTNRLNLDGQIGIGKLYS